MTEIKHNHFITSPHFCGQEFREGAVGRFWSGVPPVVAIRQTVAGARTAEGLESPKSCQASLSVCRSMRAGLSFLTT